MTNKIAKIRAALELSSEFLAQPQHTKQLLQVMESLAALAELEKAAAPQFVAGEVTEEMCQRVAASFYGADTFANGVEMHEALQLWRKELGPALGLVEIREPSDDECIAINEHVLRAHGIEGCGAVLNGRVIFDAVAKRLKGHLK